MTHWDSNLGSPAVAIACGIVGLILAMLAVWGLVTWVG